MLRELCRSCETKLNELMVQSEGSQYTDCVAMLAVEKLRCFLAPCSGSQEEVNPIPQLCHTV